MRMAVAAEGRDPESPISFRAARAPYYIIIEDGKIVEVIENPYLSDRGVGPKVASLLASKGVEKFVAGDFGPNLLNTLSIAGIVPERRGGRVADLLK